VELRAEHLGWEDTFGGDMVVQLDFTSASGHGYLV